MKCLQCGKGAKQSETVSGYELRVCDDGHRTGQLSLKETRQIETKLQIVADDGENFEFKPTQSAKKIKRVSKGVPMANMRDFDNLMGGSF